MFNNTSPQYSEEANTEHREILTEEEYNDANGEVVSAFYTPPFVIGAMWNIASRLGFKGGRILDPAGNLEKHIFILDVSDSMDTFLQRQV